MHLIPIRLPRVRVAIHVWAVVSVLVVGLPAATTLAADSPAVVLAGTDIPTANVQPGSTLNLRATAISSVDISALVDVEIYDPTGYRAYQQFFDDAFLSANQLARFPVQWVPPANAVRGTYTVKVGVVRPHWGSLYVWNDAAGQFGLGVASSATGSATAHDADGVSVSVSPTNSSIVAGNTTTAQIVVRAPSRLSALVDLEVNDARGGRVWQSFQDQQVLDDQPRTFTFDWATPANLAPGTYTIKVGVTEPNWGRLYTWVDNAASVTITQASASPLVVPTPSPSTPQPTATPSANTGAPSSTTPASNASKLFGVNESGGEFAPSVLPGALNSTYVYPNDPNRDRYFVDHGLRLLRLPVLWERLQPTPFGPLASADVTAIRASLDAAQAAGQLVILDLHNYGRYYNAPLGRGDATRFANLWRQLAQTFGNHPALYGYELMNEPHDLPEGSDGWAALAQTATDAIRQVDRSGWVLVPGYDWQGAWTWPQQNPSLAIQDPAGRLLYAAHQYFDNDGSGTYARGYEAESAYPTIGADRLRPFLDWLAAHNARGILTEYGVPGHDGRWLNVLDRFLDALNASPVIQGGTYWAAGPWWGNYPLSVEPSNGNDAPQLDVLSRYRSR